MKEGSHLIDLTGTYQDASHSPPSSNPSKLNLKTVQSASPRVIKKSKQLDIASVEKSKEKGNGIVNSREATLGEGGDKGGAGKYVGDVVVGGRTDGGRYRAVLRTVDEAMHGLGPWERVDTAPAGSTTAPDYSQPVNNTSPSASKSLSLPDTVPVPVLVLASVLDLGESSTNISQKDGVFATTDVMIHHAKVGNIPNHASEVVVDIDNGNDDDGDNDSDYESFRAHNLTLAQIDQQNKVNFPHRHFAPSIEGPAKRGKYTKKSRNGGSSNDPAPTPTPTLAPTITSPSTISDRSSLNGTESHITKEKKQLTAQLSFMIARQR